MIHDYSGLAEVVKSDQGGTGGHGRRLGTELRRLREKAGLSGRELAGLVHISQSKVSRIESGIALPTAPEVTDWAGAVAASDSEREMLTMLTDKAYTNVEPWNNPPSGQDVILELEDKSTVEMVYQPSVIPGLLQTAEYARRLFALLQPPYTKDVIAAKVAERLNRQTMLFDPGRRFEFLITEAALRLRLGLAPGAMMAAQFDRIATLSTLENVSIGLIPLDAQALTLATHGFVILEVADTDPDTIVLAEIVHAHLTMSKPDDVALYQQHWRLLREQAVSGPPASDLVAAISQDMHKLTADDP
jgi:transcriptional regulator with XRE-family HTH domain